MSNVKHAENIIRHMIDLSHPNHARDIAEELAKEGLLAADDYAEKEQKAMSNFDKANLIIGDLFKRGITARHIITEALDDAGLLMPDLPELER